MLLKIFLLLIGLIVLIKAAELMVHGASQIAKKFNVSDLAIGLTVVAFGTSAPELVVNLLAASDNHPDLVYGNVIGSNNINLFVILGISGLILPFTVHTSTVWKEIPFSFLVTFALFILANNYFLTENKELSRFDAAILLVLFCGFLYYVATQLKSEPAKETEVVRTYSWFKLIGFILVGMVGLVLGAKLVVDNAVFVAKSFEISEKIIGLTIIAIGTSFPELATSLVASLKKNSDISIGNILGSNIFNLTLILGPSVLVRPLAYPNSYNLDLYFLMGGTLFLFIAMFFGKRHFLDRWQAFLLLSTYFLYMAYLVSLEMNYGF
jgi:cation:H+ antiporter